MSLSKPPRPPRPSEKPGWSEPRKDYIKQPGWLKRVILRFIKWFNRKRS